MSTTPISRKDAEDGDETRMQEVLDAQRENQAIREKLVKAEIQALLDAAQASARVDPVTLQRSGPHPTGESTIGAIFQASHWLKSYSKRSTEESRFKGWVQANQKKLTEAAKANVYKPLTDNRLSNNKAGRFIRSNVPTKNNLRRKSEVLDIFFEQKAKFSSKKLVATAQMGRVCAKAGLNAAIDADERSNGRANTAE